MLMCERGDEGRIMKVDDWLDGDESSGLKW